MVPSGSTSHLLELALTELLPEVALPACESVSRVQRDTGKVPLPGLTACTVHFHSAPSGLSEKISSGIAIARVRVVFEERVFSITTFRVFMSNWMLSSGSTLGAHTGAAIPISLLRGATP